MFFRKIKLFNMNFFFNSDFFVRNCGVPCCNRQHFIKFIGRKLVIPTWEFYQIVRHYEKNIQNLCGIVCSDDRLCHLHKKLNCLNFSQIILEKKHT